LAACEHLGLEARVIDVNGRVIDGATVEIWQCDAVGHYRHPSTEPTTDPVDDAFQGFGSAQSNAQGQLRFRTIKPVPYPGRTAHIHFKIGGQGIAALVTQLYVAGEPRNAGDGVLNGVDVTARERVIVPFLPAPEIENNALKAAFDIVLGNAG
jgi:protocatechuate 3,4-dioxygenase beta subunit